MKIKCPACQAVLTVPDSAAGKVVKCPCGKQLRAPGGGQATSQPASPPGAQPAVNRPASPAPQRTAAGARQPARPATPQTARATPAAGGGVDAALFDELTEQDLQPVASQFSRAQPQGPTSAGGNLVQQYAPPNEVGMAGGGRTEIAAVSSRFAGYLVDVLFLSAGIGVGIGIVVGIAAVSDSDAAAIIAMIVLGLCSLVPVIINAVLITKSGQTVGKKLVGIRIVMDGTNQLPGFLHGWLLRSFIGFFLLSQFVPFYGLVNALMIFSENARMVHDRIAGTIVVRA